ncbi:MAG: response regulator [Spirochaetaceae bacterium]|nr:MAG: response regulator [Spirochaetaceae bacterium]
MSKIRVLIVDDQHLFAGSLKVVLEGHGDGEIDVVGIAYNGREALDLVGKTRPDVVLMDVRMPRWRRCSCWPRRRCWARSPLPPPGRG